MNEVLDDLPSADATGRTDPTPSRDASAVRDRDRLKLSGAWTAQHLAPLYLALPALTTNAASLQQIDASGVDAMDSAGAWVLHQLMQQLGRSAATPPPGLREPFARLLALVAERIAAQPRSVNAVIQPPWPRFARVGRATVSASEEVLGLLSFVGECTLTLGACLRHPARIRWRPILFNIRSAGVDALPIVALLSLMLGVVVAYQGAAQLRQYGANLFVADLVGLSILREFAPLITAILIAGRSGSAYAAQIGTMAVTEEIDAMRTLGIAPIEMLVLPKLLALVVTLPLLTVAADVLGVAGGMIMARPQLDVGYAEFIARLIKAISLSTYLVGLGKAPVFAAIIALVGCYQGFRTHGGADSVGRQTTRAVVQSIVLVIVADGLFSVAFSALDL